MQPSLWGPHLWRAIHYIALGFPENPEPLIQSQYKEFYLNLWKFIPCLKCSLNYKRHLQEIAPIDDYLYSPRDLFMWTWMMHNLVNKELGKSEIDFDTAYAMYQAPSSLNAPVITSDHSEQQPIVHVEDNNSITTESFTSKSFVNNESTHSSYPFVGEIMNNTNEKSQNILYPPATTYYDNVSYNQHNTPSLTLQNIVIGILFLTIIVLILFIYFKNYI